MARQIVQDPAGVVLDDGDMVAPLSSPAIAPPAGADADVVITEAIERVDRWVQLAAKHENRRSRRTMRRLEGIVVDEDGIEFVMAFIDRVARPEDPRAAAHQLRELVGAARRLPGFLGVLDRLLLRAGAWVAPHLPRVVMPLARRRMRGIVGHLVAPAEPRGLARHLAGQQRAGWASNVNLLGEAVLGDGEAARRRAALTSLLVQPDVDYVSVKLSSVEAQLNPWAHDASVAVVADRLAELLDRANEADPPTFINVDMEEYHDLELTLDAFEQVLGAPHRRHLDAGIVLQAYLPDALPSLQRLASWARRRSAAGGGTIKVRLVKGANLAMEHVDAEVHGWRAAPYATKAETDANYVRCLDWVMTDDRLQGLRIGVASHNLFHVAWATCLAERRGVRDRVQVEMLQGMAEAHAAAVASTSSARPLLYTPAVDPSDFDVAIGYLFRRLEETAAPHNFLRALFTLEPGSEVFATEAARFVRSVEQRSMPTIIPHRNQDRAQALAGAFAPGEPFQNEPETDPSSIANRRWLATVAATSPHQRTRQPTTTSGEIDLLAAAARRAQVEWAAQPPEARRARLHAVGDELGLRREVLMRTMADECGKTLAEADIEIAEAIDFARYYGEQATALERPGLAFEPFGLVSVIPPWNFPIAIASGGVLAALAAGNGVLFKPAPEAIRCGELIHEALGAAGLPDDLVALVATDDGAAARRTVSVGDAVVLTGSTETADRFRDWDPSMRLLAETSGKNALIITPHADLDLAVQDLVRSAFGHAGQKCSAASLAIVVGQLADSERFYRQLIDAVASLTVRLPEDPEALVGPLIGAPNERLHRALTSLEPGEAWLIEPALLDPDRDLWHPGVRIGVAPGSWFHRTECFGPVLGIIEAATLDEAIRLQNDSDFGLTGGIHSLDPAEIDRWVDTVEVGNAYVNRPITGAVVQRQPFGGWKRSAVGPGAKAGGPNYVGQFGQWTETDQRSADYEQAWHEHFIVEHDPSGLRSESNVFRYRPLDRIVVRHGPETPDRARELVHLAAAVAGVDVIDSDARNEVDEDFAVRLASLNVERVRLLTSADAVVRRAAATSGVHLAEDPVVHVGRVELLHYVREQSVSATLHRFGNPAPGLRPRRR